MSSSAPPIRASGRWIRSTREPPSPVGSTAASRQPAETEGRLAGVDEHITSAQIRRLTVRREQGVEGGKGHEENPCGGPDFRIKPRHRARLALRSSAPGFSRAWSGFI